MGRSPDEVAHPTPSTGPSGGDTGVDRSVGALEALPEERRAAPAATDDPERALAALLGLAESLSRARTVDDIAAHVARAAVTVTGARRVVVLVWEPEDGLLVRRATAEADAAGPGARVLAGMRSTSVALPASTVASMVRRAAPLALRGDTTTVLGAVGRAADMESGTVVPLVSASDLLGVLVLADPEPGGSGHLVGLAALAATGLGNAGLLQRIRHQSEHDPLTGLPTLRLVEELGTAGLADARRRGTPAVVLFIDLDRFRAVNERLGHSAGDRLLVQAAGRLRAVVRGADTVGRVGGDEFVVVMSQVGHLAGAQAVAERVVRSLAEPFALDGVTVTVGASVGVALSTPDDVTLAGPMTRADAALDRAKRAGRGRVALDGGGIVDPLASASPASEPGRR